MKILRNLARVGGRVRIWQHVENLRRSGFLKGALAIAGGGAVAQAIPIIFTPALTRIYSPLDFGLLGLFTAFVRFAGNAVTLEYSKAIVSASDDEEAIGLTVLSLSLVIPMSLASTLVFWLMMKQDWLGFNELPLPAIPLVLLSLVLTGMYATLRFWLLRRGEFAVISQSTIAQSVGRLASQLGLGLFVPGWWGLAGGATLGPALGLRRMWGRSGSQLSSALRHPSRQALRQVAGAYSKFPALALPSTLFNSLSLVLPVPLITGFFGLAAAGQYALTTRILLVPLSIIGGSVGDVFHNRVAVLSREAPERAMGVFIKVAAGLAIVGLVPMFVIAFYGEPLFAAILGDEWRTAGILSTALMPWVFAQLIVSPVSRVVQVFQAQEHKLVYDLLSLVSIVGILWFGSESTWSLVETSRMLGVSQAVVYGIYFALLFRIVRSHSKVALR